ncbi:MAG: cation diffusion facilitator family transporter [Alphaproteobacteria bacterium]
MKSDIIPLSFDQQAAINRRATIASVSVALILCISKLYVFLQTDSIAILTSLIDSSLDLGASLISFYAVRLAITKPDSAHRFGKGKAEPIAAVVQAGFIAGSGLLLIIESFQRLLQSHMPTQSDLGYWVMMLSIVLTLGLVTYQKQVIAKTKSVAVNADHLHYMGDLLANVGVILALFLVGFFGWHWVDALFGLLIAVYLFFSAYKVGKESLDMLMDRELPDDERQQIKAVIKAKDDIKGFHELRTRRAGPHIFIQMHIDLDPNLALVKAHSIADGLERDIMTLFPNAEVIVHQDPYGWHDRHHR